MKSRQTLTTIRSNPGAFIAALALHLVIILAVVIGYEWAPEHKLPAAPKVDVVQAVMVDESKVKAEMERLRRAEEQRLKEEQARKQQLEAQAREAQRKREAEERRLKELERKAAAEKQRLAQEQRRRQEQEQQRLAELKQKQQQEAQRLERLKAEQRALEQKQQAEKRRLAELEQQRKIEAERKRKAEAERQRREAEAKRKAEEERKRREAEAKRKAEEERKRKADEARRAEEERLRQQQFAEEQAMLTARRQAFVQSEVDRYMLLIQQRVESRWNMPSGWPKGTKCEVAIRVVPGARGGQVLDARMTKSCGNPLFDRTVETAVFNSSPLPLPTDPEVAARFRELNLIFNPED